MTRTLSKYSNGEPTRYIYALFYKVFIVKYRDLLEVVSLPVWHRERMRKYLPLHMVLNNVVQVFFNLLAPVSFRELSCTVKADCTDVIM